MTDETNTPDGADASHPKGQPPKGTARTAWEDQGSLVERLRSREYRSPAQSAAEAAEIARAEAEQVRRHRAAGDIPGPGNAAYGEGHTGAHDAHAELLPPIEPPVHEFTAEEINRNEKRAERLASLLFLLSAGCTLAFLLCYVFINVHQHPTALNLALGATLGGALFCIGAAAIVWAKGIMPHGEAVQQRYPDNSSEEAKELLARTWLQGVQESGATRRKMLLGTMGVGMGALAVPPLFLLRDLGPSPFAGPHGTNLLDITAWKKDQRLVDIGTGQPIHQSDIQIGSLTTVVPEGHADAAADSSVMVVRLAPEDLKTSAFKDHEVLGGIIAYSKICTHAGCPVSLYEQQRHHFLCPCHQSTFDAADRGKVLFGPAARALPILPIYADSDGYLRAWSPFREPVGPSFWERG